MKRLPLLMLPGWGMGPEVWQSVHFELAQRFELIMMDWSGVERVADFETKARERVEAEHWDEFALWGWSLGSLVALKLASQYPERLRQLILCGATARFSVDRVAPSNAGWPRQVLERMKRNLKQDMKATLGIFYKAQFTETEIAAGYLAGFLEQATRWEERNNADNLLLGLDYLIQADHRKTLSRIIHPTLLIHGGRDSICPVAAAELLAAHIARKCTLHIMKEAGHLPFWSRPEETLQVLDQFTSELEP